MILVAFLLTKLFSDFGQSRLLASSETQGQIVGTRKSLSGRKNMYGTQVFWHQSEARTAATVWNWSGKTLSPGALLTILYFSSFHIYFSARLDFSSSPLSAPGSPRMDCLDFHASWNKNLK